MLATGFAFYKWLSRDRGPPIEDENELSESHENKVAPYNRCGMSEVSDPDFWMEVRHLDEDPLALTRWMVVTSMILVGTIQIPKTGTEIVKLLC